ncbi:DUF3293 domain-containing protein [Pseudoalteromonas byunsanensis]|uniref:DUF3293 domain-containing protein n=1 Tax=Pseudoalteromonas byunsanensis TaxID=327939 RepID=A0A1S1N4T0_9GAMM|nr:DUF3293 domain-containing protein [Pseudoalteromonas byunsanensis]OHU93621.1 hypothetical protein BIW53_19995 [Pseudoalteromonas byunsanensis]
MVSEQLWETYQQVYFQPCDLRNSYLPRNVGQNFVRSGAIISIWNPRGQICTQRKNRLFAQKAIYRLKCQGWRYSFLWGGDKHMHYKELSVFVFCPLHSAVRLAKQNQQLAFYFIDKAGALWLINTNANEHKQRVCKLAKYRVVNMGIKKANLAVSKPL